MLMTIDNVGGALFFHEIYVQHTIFSLKIFFHFKT